jgi:hypothetical protein
MSTVELSLHNFVTIKAKANTLTSGTSWARLIIVHGNTFDDKTEELEITIFGDEGRINALASCINAEFQPEALGDESEKDTDRTSSPDCPF